MADWFVDDTIVGGNGTDPASAFASITSVTWAVGDRAWIRRTHNESIGGGGQLLVGPNYGTSGFARQAAVIGWPDVGDPFYDVRPARGTTVGWDSDNPATAVYSIYGKKFPTLTFSANGGINANSLVQLADGCVYSNLNFNIGGASNDCTFANNYNRSSVIENVMITRQMGPLSAAGRLPQPNMGKLFLAFSASNGNPLGHADLWISHAVMMSPGRADSFLSSPGVNMKIGTYENLCTSVDVFMRRSASGAVSEHHPNIEVDRVIGVEPTVAITSGNPSALGFSSPFAVNNYFGRGPVVNAGGGNMLSRGCSSAEAMHNGSRAQFVEIRSVAAAAQNYTGPPAVMRTLRKYVGVNSGQQITLDVPVYIGSSAPFSLSAIGLHASLLAAGAAPQFINAASNILPGSPTLWGGTFVAGGSAWLLRFKFTPTETGIVPFDLWAPPVLQATSGTGITGYALFSEPYSV